MLSWKRKSLCLLENGYRGPTKAWSPQLDPKSAPWEVLGGGPALLGRPGGILGGSGGRPGGVLGASRGLPGGSWGVLGESWGGAWELLEGPGAVLEGLGGLQGANQSIDCI